MYLSERRTQHLSRVMLLLSARLPADQLRAELALPMTGLMDADFYASFVWDAGQERFVRGVGCNVDPAQWARYEQHFQYDDPITQPLRARRRPTLVSQVIAQPALQATGFFNDFLRPEGMHWGVNAYAHNGRRDLGDMRIWRTRARQAFERDDLALLEAIYPALVRALDEGTPKPQAERPEALARLLAATPLSRREAEVALLVFEGRSDKEIARTLKIGFTTVRTHLAGAFRKLGCEGRAQLVRRIAQLH